MGSSGASSTVSLLSLDGQICFALYSASRALTSRYRALLAPLSVTYPQYLVLLVLWEHETASVRELGQRLQLDSGTLSPLLRRLEKSGLIVKSRASADERTVRVSLTPAGSALRQVAATIPDQICAATGLQPAEIKMLRDQVATLAEHVRMASAVASA